MFMHVELQLDASKYGLGAALLQPAADPSTLTTLIV